MFVSVSHLDPPPLPQLATGLFPGAIDYFIQEAVKEGGACAAVSLDGTDLHEDPRVTGKSGQYALMGAELGGDLGDVLGLADSAALGAQYKIHAVAIDVALDFKSAYPVPAAASLLAFVIANKEELKAKFDEQVEKLAAMRVRYRNKNGDDTDALYSQQKTWVSMVRRKLAIAQAGYEAAAKIIALLTPYAAPAAAVPAAAAAAPVPAAPAAAASLEVDELMDLFEWTQAAVRALIVCTEHYMPIKLSTYSNFSVTVGRVYYKAISNPAIFALLDKVGETLKERSGGKVLVTVEAFDGEHRGRVRGGGQYHARQAEDDLRGLMPGDDQPSARTMVGQAMRVHALCDRAITLHLNGPATTPKIAGIFTPPLAPAAAAAAAAAAPAAVAVPAAAVAAAAPAAVAVPAAAAAAPVPGAAGAVP